MKTFCFIRKFLFGFCMAFHLFCLSSCGPEEEGGPFINGDMSAFSLMDYRETFGYGWNLSAFPSYIDSAWRFFESSSVTIINDQQALQDHLCYRDTVSGMGSDSSENILRRITWADSTILAVAMKETWDYPRYVSWLRGEGFSYSLLVVAYEDSCFIRPALVEYDPVKSGFLAFIVPKIPSDSRIDLETMIVKTREEAESAMAEWLSSGN